MENFLSDDLSPQERALLEDLPKLQPVAHVNTTNVWIVEWLQDAERRTGTELHAWLEAKRGGWSHLVACKQRTDVFSAIQEAATFARRHNARPILHIEAHGNEDGLEGPNIDGELEFITWDEITPYLRELNFSTNCNLILVCAACKGIASMLSASSGDRIPCLAVIGPDSNVNPTPLLNAMKELYRAWMNGLLDLDAPSREMAPASLEIESMALLSYESFMEYVIRATRPGPRAETAEKLAKVLERMGKPYDQSLSQVNGQISLLPRRMQRAWQRLFMMDLDSENRERFGFDVKAAIWKILRFRQLA
ncbi:hypothetical protein [Pseudoxanthomonas mexicana]